MWKSSYGKNLMQDNPWSSLPSPRCKHASGWQADTFVSCSKMSPAMTDLLFLSMHSSPCHCQLARQWHFPEGKSSPPVSGKCTGSVPAEPQDQEDPYIGFLKWCSLSSRASFQLSFPNPMCWLLALKGFCKGSFPLFLLTLTNGVYPFTSSWHFSSETHEEHDPFPHPVLTLYQEFLRNILFFCMNILSRWEKINLTKYKAAQSEKKHHMMHMQ